MNPPSTIPNLNTASSAARACDLSVKTFNARVLALHIQPVAFLLAGGRKPLPLYSHDATLEVAAPFLAARYVRKHGISGSPEITPNEVLVHLVKCQDETHVETQATGSV